MRCKRIVFAAVMSVMAASCWSGAVVTGGTVDAGKVVMAATRGQEMANFAMLVSTQKQKWEMKYGKRVMGSIDSAAIIVFYADSLEAAKKEAARRLPKGCELIYLRPKK